MRVFVSLLGGNGVELVAASDWCVEKLVDKVLKEFGLVSVRLFGGQKALIPRGSLREAGLEDDVRLQAVAQPRVAKIAR